MADKNQLFRLYTQNSRDINNTIAKALTSASGTGDVALPSLEKQITNTLIRIMPELALLTPVKTTGKAHNFNQLIARPARGGAQGESGTPLITNSRSIQTSVPMKVIQRNGRVTNFVKDASTEVMDIAQWEMQNQLEAHAIDMVFYLLYGNKGANAYEADGLTSMINTNYLDYSQFLTGAKVAGGAIPSTLEFIDYMIDSSNVRGGKNHNRWFEMTPQMLSKISRLTTNVLKYTSADMIGSDIFGGIRLNTYRGIPIVETSALRTIEAMSSTVTVTTGGTTLGGLSNGDYFIYVAPMTANGEQAPCAEQPITLSGGGSTQRIKIDLSANHSTNENGTAYDSAYQYKIYVGRTTGSVNAKLVKVVSAAIYGADGSPISYNNGVDASIYVTVLTGDASVPTAMANDIPLTAVSGAYPESVVLWDGDPIQGLGKVPYINTAGDKFSGLVTIQDLAALGDYINFLVKSYYALVPAFEATSVWMRNIRTH